MTTGPLKCKQPGCNEHATKGFTLCADHLWAALCQYPEGRTLGEFRDEFKVKAPPTQPDWEEK